jgi:hypothetical protein
MAGRRGVTKTTRVRWVAVLGLLVATVALARAVRVSVFPPGAQDAATLNAGLPASEYGYHPDPDGSWGESWSMQAVNAAGDYVYVLMSVSNYHPFHKYGGTADVFYYPAAGTRHKTHAEFTSDRVRADKGRVSVDIGGNTLAGPRPAYRVHAGGEGLVADLTFQVQTPDFRQGQDFLRFGENRERYWNLTVLAPRATVSGTITVDGKAIPFSGRGYMDHGWSTEKLYKFSKTWYVVRLVEDDVSVNVVDMNFRDGYEPRSAQAIFVTEGDRVLANSGAVTMTHAGGSPDPRSGLNLPETYAIAYDRGGVKLTGTVRMTRLVESLNVLDQLSPVLRKIVTSLVTDPWQIRFAGQADLTLTRGGQTRRIVAPVVGEVHSYK